MYSIQILIDRVVEYESSTNLFTRISKTGCPQGGTASPCLWLIAMNDLLMNLKNAEIESLAYADDLCMMITGRSLNELKNNLNKALEIIENWCRLSSLKISPDKSQVMNVGYANFNEQITINDKPVEVVKSIKYLGVMLDESMKWKAHIDLIEQKVNKCIRVCTMMRFMSPEMSVGDKRIIYNQVFISIVGYAAKVWFSDLKYKYQLEAINRMQRKMLLCLSGAYRTSSSVKLRRLFQVIELDKNLDLLCKFDKEERMKRYEEELMRNGSDVDYSEVRRKELIWFVIGHAPCLAYLKRFHLAEDDICRFCAMEIEDPEHLLFNCTEFKDLKNSNLKELEMKSKEIVMKIYKLN